MTLKQLLYADLARQYQLEGRGHLQPNFFGFLVRLLHFRYLPNVILRTSRAALLAGIPLLPSALTYLNLVLFGVEASPKCEIGPGFFMPHPVACVIGAWHIGSNVTMFGGVGLGAVNDMGFHEELRCHIGNNVILGTGCKVMGPYTVGDNVKIGANSVVTSSVENNQTVVGMPARAMETRRAGR